MVWISDTWLIEHLKKVRHQCLTFSALNSSAKACCRILHLSRANSSSCAQTETGMWLLKEHLHYNWNLCNILCNIFYLMAVTGYSSYVANSVLSAFLCYTAIILNSVTIHAIRKTSSLPKPLKTLLLSLAVSDLGVGLLVLPLHVAVLVLQLEPNAENNPAYNHSKKVRVPFPTEFILLCNVLWCYCSNCWQDLGHSSSQIPRTCDSQTCCCCGDLDVGIRCIHFVDWVVGHSTEA